MQTDAFHVFDTTLRDGAQREGISYSVADKLAVARLLDQIGVGFIEGGWPGAMPKDTEFFARAADGELALTNAVLVAFGATRKAGVAVEDDRAGAGVAGFTGHGRHPGGQVRCPPRRPARCAPRWRRTWRWSPTRSRSCAPTTGGCSSTASTSSTATRRPRLRRAGPAGRGRRRAPTSASCATPTAACCPWASAASSPTCPPARACGWASTPRTTPPARWPTRWPRSKPAPPTCRARPTATANGRATPTSSPSSPAW